MAPSSPAVPAVQLVAPSPAPPFMAPSGRPGPPGPPRELGRYCRPYRRSSRRRVRLVAGVLDRCSAVHVRRIACMHRCRGSPWRHRRRLHRRTPPPIAVLAVPAVHIAPHQSITSVPPSRDHGDRRRAHHGTHPSRGRGPRPPARGPPGGAPRSGIALRPRGSPRSSWRRSTYVQPFAQSSAPYTIAPPDHDVRAPRTSRRTDTPACSWVTRAPCRSSRGVCSGSRRSCRRFPGSTTRTRRSRRAPAFGRLARVQPVSTVVVVVPPPVPSMHPVVLVLARHREHVWIRSSKSNGQQPVRMPSQLQRRGRRSGSLSVYAWLSKSKPGRVARGRRRPLDVIVTTACTWTMSAAFGLLTSA